MPEIRFPLFNMCGKEIAAAGYRKIDVIRAYEHLYRDFGAEWIEREMSRKAGGMLDKHPLLAGMGTDSMPAIVQALELAVILQHFAQDPHLPGLMGNLRDCDQFGDVYYALRVALRFRLIGFDVTLEPQTAPGKADVLARGKSMLIGLECTNVRHRFRGRLSLVSCLESSDTIDEASQAGHAYRLGAVLVVQSGVGLGLGDEFGNRGNRRQFQ